MNLKQRYRKNIVIGTMAFLLLSGGTNTFASEENSQIDLSSKEIQQELNQDLKDMELLKNQKIDEKELKKELKILKKNNPEKYDDIVESEIQVMSTGKMGYGGDILITYDNETLGWNHGHAAIVRANNDYIVEAWPKAGVRNYKNNWANRFDSKKKFYVKGATATKNYEAQKYAYSRIGQDYSITAAKSNLYIYYCSQLVWQAWSKQGFDLDSNGGAIVTPANLENSPLTIKY